MVTILVQVLQFAESYVLNTVLDAAFDVNLAAVILNDLRMLWLEFIGLGPHDIHLVATGEVSSRTTD